MKRPKNIDMADCPSSSGDPAYDPSIFDHTDVDITITLPGVHLARLIRVAETYSVGQAHRLSGWTDESARILAAMDALHSALRLVDLDYS